MIVRKLFKFEAAHRVRTADSYRCKNSIHGHSYLVEVFMESPVDDDMVVDFATLKQKVGHFFDCMDHATFIWDLDNEKYKEFIYDFSHRVIRMAKDPTAENMARAFLRFVDGQFCKDVDVRCSSVRVHETATGFAEATDYSSKDIIIIEHPNDD